MVSALPGRAKQHSRERKQARFNMDRSLSNQGCAPREAEKVKSVYILCLYRASLRPSLYLTLCAHVLNLTIT